MALFLATDSIAMALILPTQLWPYIMTQILHQTPTTATQLSPTISSARPQVHREYSELGKLCQQA